MATEAKIIYTTAPAEYDREASTVLSSPYVYKYLGLPLRKVLVPGPDYAVQFNTYLKHADHATVSDAMIEGLLRKGTVQDSRETSVAAQEVIKRNNNDNNDKEQAMASRNADSVTDTAATTKTRKGGRKAPVRTNNTETTIIERPDSVHTIEHPANVPVPQVAALAGMTPLGIAPETTPAALDTPAEQAAAQPKTRRGKKAQTTTAPAPDAEGPAAETVSINTLLATGAVERPAAVGLVVPTHLAAFEEKVSYVHVLLACDVATIQDAFRNGFVAVGSQEKAPKAPRAASTFTPNPNSNMAQMTFAIAQTIRAEAAKKELSQKQLADKFATTRIMIWDILHGVRFVVESEGSTTRPKAQWTK